MGNERRRRIGRRALTRAAVTALALFAFAATPALVSDAAAQTETVIGLTFFSADDVYTFDIVTPPTQEVLGDTLDCCIAGDSWGMRLKGAGGVILAEACGSGSTTEFSGLATATAVTHAEVYYCSGVDIFPAGMSARWRFPGGAGEVIPTGSCTSPSRTCQAAPSPQHYATYDVTNPERVTETVTLSDQFGTRTVRLEEIDWLWNPAEKRRVGHEPSPILRPSEHYACYEIPYISTASRTVHVRNQFVGDSTLTVGRPLALCTPAAKTHTGTPGSFSIGADHYQCYDVTGESPRFTSETLGITDQFGARTIRLDRARELCNPVAKTRASGAVEPIQRPDEHFVCYRITTFSPSFSALTVFTRTQFGLDSARVVSPRRLCVPSDKSEGGGV